MGHLFTILLTTAVINNVILSQFLGICSFLGVSRQVKTAFSMGMAVIFVLTLSSAITSILYGLIAYLHVEFMETIVFILVIAALVQLVEMYLKKYSPGLYAKLGVYLPLITTNCAVLGVALTNVQNNYGFLECVVAGLGTAIGYTIAIVIMAGIREKIEMNDIPESFKGSPIILVTSGLMAIAFIAFSWLV